MSMTSQSFFSYVFFRRCQISRIKRWKQNNTQSLSQRLLFFFPSSLFRTLTLLNKNPWTFLKHFYFIVPMTSEEQLEIKKNAEKKIFLFYPVFKQINTIFLHWLIFFIISLLIFKNFFFLSSFEFYVCEWLLLLFLQQ